MTPSIQQQRQKLLNEMSQIEKMELGTLGEEIRSKTVGGKAVTTGPYYKHQQWVDGRNRSRRVPLEEVEELRAAVEGRQHFENLATRFIELTVAETRSEMAPEVKKNAAKSKRRNSKKPKLS